MIVCLYFYVQCNLCVCVCVCSLMLLHSDTVKELFISDLLLEDSKLKTFEQV